MEAQKHLYLIHTVYPLVVFSAEIGADGLSSQCASQESSLALLWNIGIFALNFGPVFLGPTLDFVGPKLTAILGLSLLPYRRDAQLRTPEQFGWSSETHTLTNLNLFRCR